MILFRDYGEVETERRSAVTVGNFDGVHLGHRALIDRVVDSPHAATVLTFEPHPREVLCPGSAPSRLCSAADRRALLESCGVELVLEQPFSLDFASKAPDAFVREVLVGALRAAHVVVGYDFTFGARASGDCDTLRALGAELDFAVESVAALESLGAAVSSTRVREAVATGEMGAAQTLLGRCFSLVGEVVEGAKRGRTLGFPTANLRCDTDLLPALGVYAGWLDWGSGPAASVVNIGVNPTFGPGHPPTVEAHVVGRDDLGLYGRRARLYLRARLREERRFDGPSALRAQIAADRAKAIELLSEAALPEWP